MNASSHFSPRPHHRRRLPGMPGLGVKKLTIGEPDYPENHSPEKDRKNIIGFSPRPHHRRRLPGMPGLGVKKLTIDEPDYPEENRNPEKDGNIIGTVMRNEKIENARSIADAVRQQRQEQQAPTPPSPSSSPSVMRKALLERLEAKLLANEMECTELRKLTEARKRGIPVSLASLNLGCDLEQDSCIGDSYLLKKLEALVLVKEEECAMARKLFVDASKRGLPRTERGVTRSVSLAPTSILRPRASPRRAKSSVAPLARHKSVTWGTNSVSL
jgi:hypothetical protein